MSREAKLNFQNQVRALNKAFEEIHLPSIERTHAQMSSLPVSDFAGRGRELMTEAQVKTCLLDPILGSLQWNLEILGSILVEAPLAPLTTDNHRRFLDYHGREVSEDSSDRSLLVIEAKRPSVSLPGDASRANELFVKDIIEALDWMSSVKMKKKGVNAEWIARLETLSDYVKRVHSTYSNAPCRAVITNSEWYVIFNNPEKTFVVGSLSVDDIIIFKNLQDIENRANEFYDNIAYVSLSKRIPPQHPSGLINFVNPGETVYVAHAIEIIFKDINGIQPIIALRLFVRVRTARKTWILIKNEYIPPYELLNQKNDKVSECLLIFEKYSNNLLNELKKYANLIILTPLDYEKLLEDDGIQTKWNSSYLCEERTGNAFEITTCNNSFHLTSNDQYDGCPYHTFGNCVLSGNASGSTAIYSPSLSPKAYFHSGSIFHCAHKSVHTLREKDCVILPVDTYLCCRRCVYFDRCWTDGGNRLPCVIGTSIA